jgi:hypothetical protein
MSEVKMGKLPKAAKYIKTNYVILTKDEARAILAKIRQADIILRLAFREKRNDFWT